MLLFSFFCHLIQCERLEITQTCMFNPMPVEASTGSKQGYSIIMKNAQYPTNIILSLEI